MQFSIQSSNKVIVSHINIESLLSLATTFMTNTAVQNITPTQDDTSANQELDYPRLTTIGNTIT